MRLAGWIFALGLGLLLAPQVLAQSPYRILVTSVDSSEFPRVKVHFKAILQDPDQEPWKETMGIKVSETVLGDTVSDITPENIDLCEIRPVAVGVAIDVSGSVSGVMDEIAQGAASMFRQMKEDSETYSKLYPDTYTGLDAGALYAFSTANNAREPLPSGSNQTYATSEGLETLAQKTTQIPTGGGSPIWAGMSAEANMLAQYRPEDKNLERVLVTLTDGQDNESSMTDVNNLLYFAQQSGITLVNLGYGETNDFGLSTISQMSGGVYVPGIERRISHIMKGILDGMRKTYCIEYISPHPHMVNEPAMVTVETAGAQGQGVFPLPFVVPEDSSDVRLFVPMTEYAYKGLLAGNDVSNQPIYIQGKARLHNKEGEPWADANNAGPERRLTEVDIYSAEWSEGTPGDPLSGWGFYLSGVTSDWVEMFKTPTDRIDMVASAEELFDKGKEQLIEGVSHWQIEADLEQTNSSGAPDQSRASRSYPSKIRLSIQDRTPPSILVRALPQDGTSFLEARLVPAEIDQDTQSMQVKAGQFLTSLGELQGSRPTYQSAALPGQGAKRARCIFSWSNPKGEPVQGAIDQQHWTHYQVDPSDPRRRTPTFWTDSSLPAQGGPNTPYEHGITVIAGNRMMLRVAARDNFGGLKESRRSQDRKAYDSTFVDGQSTLELPEHANFQLSEAEAIPFQEEAPYLPFKSKSELEADTYLAGVTWWIESHVSGDRLGGVEGIEEVRYIVPDSAESVKIPAGAHSSTPRKLIIRAQDGEGNHTVLELPLRVIPNRFDSYQLDYRSERADFLD